MTNHPTAIWIDLDNSPHVPLFLPVIRHYQERGIELILTARDHSQTLELIRIAGLADNVAVIGRHYGKGRFAKARGLLVRARELVRHIRRLQLEAGEYPRVAISHGSRSMVLAARWLKIPIITMYDYEYTETRIFNRFSNIIAVPDGIEDKVLDEIGVPAAKLSKYTGLKEELYLNRFQASGDLPPELSAALAANAEKVIVVLRPPAVTANYHSAASEDLLHALVEKLAADDNTFTIVVPRTHDQAGELRDLLEMISSPASRFLILESAVDGLELLNSADVVISGGGTMNREAVLLGREVYSFFAGRQGSLDRQMESDGRIKFLRTAADISRMELKKRHDRGDPAPSADLTARVETFVINQIDAFLDEKTITRAR